MSDGWIYLTLENNAPDLIIPLCRADFYFKVRNWITRLMTAWKSRKEKTCSEKFSTMNYGLQEKRARRTITIMQL
jgi:hypothetical protein